jgi:hypothetical protein
MSAKEDEARYKEKWDMDFVAVKKLATEILDRYGFKGEYTVITPDTVFHADLPQAIASIDLRHSDGTTRITIKRPAMKWIYDANEDAHALEYCGSIAIGRKVTEYSWANINTVFQEALATLVSTPIPQVPAYTYKPPPKETTRQAIIQSVEESDSLIGSLLTRVHERAHDIARASGHMSVEESDHVARDALLQRMAAATRRLYIRDHSTARLER